MNDEHPKNEVVIDYEGETVRIASVNDNDHILTIMRDTGSFYEVDVLQLIRERVADRKQHGIAIDAGAFIGTHSIYFAKYCHCDHVICFEANPDTFPVLDENLKANVEPNQATAVNVALGASPGTAVVIDGADNNAGSTSVDYVSGVDGPTIPVTTVDDEIARMSRELGSPSVALIKVDVEGAELDVLRGAKKTVSRHLPILCVEMHSAASIANVLSLLKSQDYLILDCLGYSPTYVLEPRPSAPVRRRLANFLWVLRAYLPTSMRRMKWYMSRVARMVGVGG